MRHKTHRQENRFIFIFKFIVLPAVLAIGLTFETSNIAKNIGDKLLETDRLTNASFAYSLSNVLNPFDNNSKIRFKITKVLLAEKTTNDEETTDPIKNDYVLGASTTQIPVVMYHYIRINPYADDIKGFDLSVTPYMFSKQMDWLITHGYHTISLDELGANLLYHASLPKKPVVLTFDDGYRDFYTSAFPILKQHNMKGTSFVITGFVDSPRYLTWDEIHEMRTSGLITFESHTVDHAPLTSITSAQAIYELTQSKKDLEKHLGYPVNWFAYPGGNVNPSVVTLVKQTGYIGAFGTQMGTFESTDTKYTQPRVRVSGGDNVESFAQKLPWK